jgi:hypothetical protein
MSKGAEGRPYVERKGVLLSALMGWPSSLSRCGMVSRPGHPSDLRSPKRSACEVTYRETWRSCVDMLAKLMLIVSHNNITTHNNYYYDMVYHK